MLLKYICNKNSIQTKSLDMFQALFFFFFFTFYAFSWQQRVQQLN